MVPNFESDSYDNAKNKIAMKKQFSEKAVAVCFWILTAMYAIYLIKKYTP